MVMERKVIRQKVAKTDRQGEELLTTVKEWGNARTPENRIG